MRKNGIRKARTELQLHMCGQIPREETTQNKVSAGNHNPPKARKAEHK